MPNNQCPPGPPTVSDYGGVRLALQKGDVLKIRPALDPIKVNHSSNPGGANLVHGISLNQASSGLSGIISVGAAGDYAVGRPRQRGFDLDDC